MQKSISYAYYELKNAENIYPIFTTPGNFAYNTWVFNAYSFSVSHNTTFVKISNITGIFIMLSYSSFYFNSKNDYIVIDGCYSTYLYNSFAGFYIRLKCCKDNIIIINIV